MAQYGHMVRQMQAEAAAILSDAQSQLDVSKSCPAAQASLSQASLSQGGQPQDDTLQTGLLRSVETKGDLKVFVSFSMSDGALKSLAAALVKLKTGSLVMRGLDQNSFQKTALKLKNLGISVTIDPEAFEKFHVTSVPQIVLSESTGTGVHDTLRGNVSLDFALSEFAEKGDTSAVAKPLLLALRKRP